MGVLKITPRVDLDYIYLYMWEIGEDTRPPGLSLIGIAGQGNGRPTGGAKMSSLGRLRRRSG